jgi:acyl carrier protein
MPSGEAPLNRQKVTAHLTEIFAAVLQLPAGSIDPTLSPDTCEMWDSLHHLHLMSAIDETFAFHLDMEQQVEILTFDLAVEIVCEALADEGRLSDAEPGKG